MRYESTLNRGAMIANYEINCGVLNAEQMKKYLMLLNITLNNRGLNK